jgi:hypothetical protein
MENHWWKFTNNLNTTCQYDANSIRSIERSKLFVFRGSRIKIPVINSETFK